MRLANRHGRLVLVREDRAIDVAQASGGRFGPDPQSIYGCWQELHAWAEVLPEGGEWTALEHQLLGPPVPAPRQIFAVGLNYGDRARAAGEPMPAMPPVFPKFQGCLTGPQASVAIPGECRVDFEVELVVVIARRAFRIPSADAWSYVAGLMVGQDLSDRRAQFRPPVPQFGLAKSRPGFGPTGPYLVSADELRDANDLAISCSVNGDVRQHDRTSSMLVGVAELIERLSEVLPLLPGDLLFTGTPGGVGHYDDPPRYLAPGDELQSSIEGLGTQRVTFTAG